jgi:hypothetical protein
MELQMTRFKDNDKSKDLKGVLNNDLQRCDFLKLGITLAGAMGECVWG